MYIKIAGLSEGSHTYRFDDNVEHLGLEKPFFGNFSADVELNKSHSQIVLKVNVRLKAAFECDRCTRNYEQELNPVYTVVDFFGSEPQDNTDVNVIYIPHEADKIDLVHEMRDYSLLAVPMKKLHSPDCKGLCFRCGIDLNEADCSCDKESVDSKWLPLKELKNKLSNN